MRITARHEVESEVVATAVFNRPDFTIVVRDISMPFTTLHRFDIVLQSERCTRWEKDAAVDPINRSRDTDQGTLACPSCEFDVLLHT
jgi:hypothetical protein